MASPAGFTQAGPAPQRVVLLGASNLTRAFATVLDILRSSYDAPLDLLAAHGLGRSFGLRSTVLFRKLPGIRDCGIWDALENRPPLPTAALLTDIGNDLLYEVPVDTIVEWVEVCLERLRQRQARIVMTLLPLGNLATLSTLRYRFFRTLSHPRCSLSLATITDRAHELNRQLQCLGAAYSVQLLEPQAEWYGLDPIHILGRWQPQAWSEILAPLTEVIHTQGIERCERLGTWAAWRLAPEQRWLWGRERQQSQPVARLPDGTSISLF